MLVTINPFLQKLIKPNRSKTNMQITFGAVAFHQDLVPGELVHVIGAAKISPPLSWVAARLSPVLSVAVGNPTRINKQCSIHFEEHGLRTIQTHYKLPCSSRKAGVQELRGYLHKPSVGMVEGGVIAVAQHIGGGGGGGGGGVRQRPSEIRWTSSIPTSALISSRLCR